jgi:uncharacterized protein YjgD (DUF1641 family)
MATLQRKLFLKDAQIADLLLDKTALKDRVNYLSGDPQAMKAKNACIVALQEWEKLVETLSKATHEFQQTGMMSILAIARHEVGQSSDGKASNDADETAAALQKLKAARSAQNQAKRNKSVPPKTKLLKKAARSSCLI